VSDFGLARFQIPKELMYTACGTPAYVAPEVLEGKGYDLRVDSWSLGVIIYVMLCGFPPFYDEDNDKMFELIKKGNYDFPSPYWDEISSSAKDLISKLLVVDPKRRLSADEVLNHEWLIGKTTPKKPMDDLPNKIKDLNAKLKPFRVTFYAALLANKLLKLLKSKKTN
jgi:calcium/calmodulin-dependent protein kinase I